MQPTGTSAMHPVPWFLATTPSSGPDMLPRNAVADILQARLGGMRSVFVAAPSGFGKTVAVSQWAAGHRCEAPGSVAWLTLTERVNGSGDVLRGILTALLNAARERGDEAAALAVSGIFESVSYDAGVAALMALDHPRIVLIVDDYQLARDRWPDAVEFVENGPQWLQFVMITTDPVGPVWARLRVHHKVAMMGPAELAFTRGEVEALVAAAGDTADVDRIMAATDGWPGAVRLILVSGDDTEAFTPGTDLTDYISTAVLARLRPDLADFALKATVCSRVDEQLAAALSGRTDSAVLLNDCVGAGLFIERIGTGESAVYQWHSLFVRHCREILRRDNAQEWLRLNQIAARELAQRYPLDAVDHAIVGGDRVAHDIIGDHWLELLLQSRSTALDQACLRLTEAFGEDPEILMIRSSCRAMAGDDIMATLLLNRAAAMPSASRRTQFVADLTQLLVSDDREAMSEAAARVEAALADRDIVTPRVYACALFVLGWADSRLRRSATRGSELLEAAMNECAALGLPEVAHRARQSLAFALAHSGEIARAQAALQRVVVPAESTPELWLSHDGDGIERFTAGWIHFWHGEITTAVEYLIPASTAPGVGYPDTSRMFLAFSAATLRDSDVLATAELGVARMPDVDTHGVPWVSYKTASRARLAEARGDHRLALELAASVLGSEHVPMVSAVMSGMCRRLGAHQMAVRLAHQALEPHVPAYIAAYALSTLAYMDWQEGQADSAHMRMEEAISAARPERVRYQFVDNPDAVCRDLLAAHLSYTSYPDFVEEALLECERAVTDGIPAALTPREQELLAFLRTPMTMQDIAEKMGVSVNTPKTHQRAIYRKLGATNRREAIKLAGR
ncbi:LuxR C-terminal-related transcriptional regulator [Mycobacterium aquaticum]|nr:LuxR C-terminal-related transcriptional regulator [Mycobacterium aquaticum]